MQACRSRFKYSVLNFNAEKNIKYRGWSSFSICQSLACPQLMMIPTLAATQIAIATPVSQVVEPRTCATLPDAHISSGSVATETPAQTPVVPLASDSQIAPMKKNCTPHSLAAQGCISKRLPSEASHGQVPATQLAKKRKVVGFSPALASAAAVPSSRRGSNFSSAAPANVPSHCISPVPPVSCGPALSPEQAGGRRLVQTQTRGTSGKRFKPPKMMRPAPAPKEATSGNAECTQITSSLHGEEGAGNGSQLIAIRHQYLDFPAPMVPPALSPITLPPSLAERKLVQRWAIILTGLSDKERFRCCFVSKLIRYAGKCRLPRSFDSMPTVPRQSTHRPTISSAKTSLGSVYPFCCNRLANLHL
jgi:hypothetical protein